MRGRAVVASGNPREPCDRRHRCGAALAEAAGEDMIGVCQALFSAYVQTDQEDMAKSVQTCAGYEDM